LVCLFVWLDFVSRNPLSSAHSTAYFWGSSAAFYFGGALYYNSNGLLEYNAGRDRSGSEQREPPTQNLVTNSKVFLTPNVGIGSWSGRMDVVKYEAHDVGLALEALVSGFWIDQMAVSCRTTELLKLPVQRADYVRGNGFVWCVSNTFSITCSFLRYCCLSSQRIPIILST
jgi:hypothetical protein